MPAWNYTKENLERIPEHTRSYYMLVTNLIGKRITNDFL